MTESQNGDHGYIKDHWQYQNQDPYVKHHSGTSSILQSPNWGLEGCGCSLHLQNQDREPKFRKWMYQRPVTISKSRSRCQTPVKSLQHPQKSRRGLKEYRCYLHFQNQERVEIWKMGLSKTSDYIRIKIKMPNPNWEPQASPIAPYEDLKDSDVLCAFKIKIETKFRTWMYQRSVTISKSR